MMSFFHNRFLAILGIFVLMIVSMGTQPVLSKPPTEPDLSAIEGRGSANRLTEKYIEVDENGEDLSLFPGTEKIVSSYLISLGIHVNFVREDDDLGMGDTPCSWKMIKDSNKYFQNVGKPGWHHLIIGKSGVGSIRGWGAMNGNRLFIFEFAWNGSKFPECSQANIFLHEFGHNMGLTHEGVDGKGHGNPPGMQTTCVMNPGKIQVPPVTNYCPPCEEFIRKKLLTQGKN